MAKLTIDNRGRLRLLGDGWVEFDTTTPPKVLVEAIRAQPHSEETSLPELFPVLSSSAKDLLREVVDADPVLTEWFQWHSKRFASIGSKNGQYWTRPELQPAWCRYIKTWLLDEIIKDRSGIVFVRLNCGEAPIRSEFEFFSIEGKSLEQHLDDFIETTSFSVREIKAILRAPLIEREVQAVNPDGAMENLRLVGPEILSVDQWAHPPGYTLMCSEFP